MVPIWAWRVPELEAAGQQRPKPASGLCCYSMTTPLPSPILKAPPNTPKRTVGSACARLSPGTERTCIIIIFSFFFSSFLGPLLLPAFFRHSVLLKRGKKRAKVFYVSLSPLLSYPANNGKAWEGEKKLSWDGEEGRAGRRVSWRVKISHDSV